MLVFVEKKINTVCVVECGAHGRGKHLCMEATRQEALIELGAW